MRIAVEGVTTELPAVYKACNMQENVTHTTFPNCHIN